MPAVCPVKGNKLVGRASPDRLEHLIPQPFRFTPRLYALHDGVMVNQIMPMVRKLTSHFSGPS